MVTVAQKKNETDEVTSTVTEEQKTESAENASENKQKPRVCKHPGEVAALVLSQLKAVNAKKGELTIAIISLSDLTKQLANIYASHTNTMQQMQARIKELEGQSEEK